MFSGHRATTRACGLPSSDKMSDTALDSDRKVLDKELERLPEYAVDELEKGCLEEQVKGQ